MAMEKEHGAAGLPELTAAPRRRLPCAQQSKAVHTASLEATGRRQAKLHAKTAAQPLEHRHTTPDRPFQSHCMRRSEKPRPSVLASRAAIQRTTRSSWSRGLPAWAGLDESRERGQRRFRLGNCLYPGSAARRSATPYPCSHACSSPPSLPPSAHHSRQSLTILACSPSAPGHASASPTRSVGHLLLLT